MFSIKKLAFAVVTGLAALSSQAAGTRAEVIHWWTSGGGIGGDQGTRQGDIGIGIG